MARFTGIEEISTAIQQQWAAQPVMTHWTANISVDLRVGSTQAHAQVDTDTLTQLASGDWLQSAGTYHDVLECRDGRWGFVERRAEVHFSMTLVAKDINRRRVNDVPAAAESGVLCCAFTFPGTTMAT